MSEEIPFQAVGAGPCELIESERGVWLLAKALHYAIKYIGTLPRDRRSGNDREEMLAILNGCFPSQAQVLREMGVRQSKIDTDDHPA
jgi:hypothetical protein